MKHTLSFGGLLLAVWCWPQDPPATPPGPAATPPAVVPTPPVASPAPHAFVGVYRLRERVVDGTRVLRPSHGHLFVSQRHLCLAVAAPTDDPDHLLLRTAVRSFRLAGNELTMTTLTGWFTDAEGTVHIERVGHTEQRRLEPLQGGVRLQQDLRNWLDFERIE